MTSVKTVKAKVLRQYESNFVIHLLLKDSNVRVMSISFVLSYGNYFALYVLVHSNKSKICSVDTNFVCLRVSFQ